MKLKDLVSNIKIKKSCLCIGLDTDINKIPRHLKSEKDPIFAFNKAIIEQTTDLCIAYKPNIAFYESLGPKGWESLEKTLEIIPKDSFTIADAKRGDIGNTSEMYAKTFFEFYNFDAITVAPYMGEDSVLPFFKYEDKWVIMLGLTSNKGSQDFQNLETDGQPLYQKVIQKGCEWGDEERMMFVIGATHPEKIGEIRKLAPNHFFLVPGVGAQGGDLRGIMENGQNENCGLIINSSREILYAGTEKDFAEKARIKAKEVQEIMSEYI